MNVYIWTGEMIPGYQPIAHWKLENNLNDDIGGNNGSWSSGTGSFVTAGGKTGAKIEVQETSYNKSSRYISTNLAFPNYPFSICLWVYTYTANDIVGVLTSRNGNNTDKFVLWNTNGSTHIATIAINGGTNGRYQADSYGLNNFLNQWVCLGLSVDSSGTQFYINGSKVATSLYQGTRPSSIDNTGYTLALGIGNYSSYWSAFQGLNGLIREVAIWNKKLDDNVFLEYYNLTK